MYDNAHLEGHYRPHMMVIYQKKKKNQLLELPPCYIFSLNCVSQNAYYLKCVELRCHGNSYSACTVYVTLRSRSSLSEESDRHEEKKLSIISEGKFFSSHMFLST